MPDHHARLAPSAAERWLQCPASIRMEALVPSPPDSPYALEGTCAHELAELKASVEFGLISRATFTKRLNKWREAWSVTEVVEFEMTGHAEAYVEVIRAELALYPGSRVVFEQRLDTGVPACWGTSDAVILSSTHVGIVDYKYGRGVAVEAENNPQLRLYGLGALDAFGDIIGDTDEVRITVHQPRLDHVLTEVVTADELRAWRDKVIPVAVEALGDDARFGPSETACRWCPASGNCRAQLESIFTADFTAKPETLDADELPDLLGQLTAIRTWCDAVESAAFQRVYHEGTEVPGYKVVLAGGKRSITDAELAIKYAVEELGYTIEQVSRPAMRTLGELEALMTKTGFAEKMADYIKPPIGRPSLVPDTDKRPSIQPDSEAARVFAETIEEER